MSIYVEEHKIVLEHHVVEEVLCIIDHLYTIKMVSYNTYVEEIDLL
jgi:hypothetical protein